MLLTKHKVQELVEGIEIGMDEIEANAIALVEGFDDDSVTLVYVAIETFKDKILDELGRVS